MTEPPSDDIINLLTSLSSHTTPIIANSNVNNEDHQSNLSSLEQVITSNPRDLCYELVKVLRYTNNNQPVQCNNNIAGYYENQIQPLAGLVLKNILCRKEIVIQLDEKVIHDIGSSLLDIMILHNSNTNIVIENVVGNCISALYTHKGSWMELIQGTGALLIQEEDMKRSVRLLHMLEKILVDNSHKLEELSTLVPQLLQVLELGSSGGSEYSVKMLEGSLKCMRVLIADMPAPLLVARDDYLKMLGKIGTQCHTTGSIPSVEALVCSSLVSLLSLRPEYLEAEFPSICEFILISSSSSVKSEEVALEAVEFWLSFSNLEEFMTPAMLPVVQEMLPRLIPVLLNDMIHSKDEIEEFAIEEVLPDEDEVNAPVFYTSKHSSKGNDIDLDEDDSDDDGGLDDEDNTWTVRKCAAASLDALSLLYGSAIIIPILLPHLEQSLLHTDPWVREASVLALGAIAHGCQEGMKEHLPSILPYLTSNLSSHQHNTTTNTPQLQMISCWTIGRYAVDFIQHDANTLQQIWSLLSTNCILNTKSTKLQLAACSAWDVIIESCDTNPGWSDVNFLTNIYQVLLHTLQTPNLPTRLKLVVFDTFGVMAEYLPTQTSQGTLPNFYIPPLIQYWSLHSNNLLLERILLPLVETLSSIILAVGVSIQPYSTSIFELSFATMDACMIHLAITSNPSEEESDPLVSSLDVIDALMEALGGSNFQTLLDSKPNVPFQNVILYSMKSDVPSVRMSAFAILGDVSRHCPSILTTHLEEYILEMLRCIYNPMHASVCNNAVWAMGEISKQCVGQATIIAPYANQIVDALIPLLMEGNGLVGSNVLESGIPGLPENAAACMGRLALVDATFITKDMYRFLSGWCEGLAKISDPIEKHDGFQGLLYSIQNVISTTPNFFIDLAKQNNNNNTVIPSLLLAILSWNITLLNDDQIISIQLFYGSNSSEDGSSLYTVVDNPDSELNAAFTDLLTYIQNSFGEESWGIIAKSLPVTMRQLLRTLYKV